MSLATVASFQELLGLQVGLTQVSLFRKRCVHGVPCRWGLELLSVLIEKGSVVAGRGRRVSGLLSYQHACLLIFPALGGHCYCLYFRLKHDQTF